MKLVCPKCGYRTEAEVHTEQCPKCKSPMQQEQPRKRQNKKSD